MITENKLFEALANVPELPPSLFGKIDGRIRRRSMFVKTLFALAATVVVTVGTAGVLVTHRGTGQIYSSEVAAELQSVKSYLAGDDLEREFTSYVLYGDETIE
jgi:hypothetical protein